MAYHRFIVLTAVLAFVVIVLGAYTRLTDAGLGCPDWPGCYGKLLVPESPEQVIEKQYLEQRPLEPEKGWMEMIHRYFAGTLGLFILVLNAAMFGLVAALLDDFVVSGFWAALFGAIIVSITSTIASWYIGPDGHVEVIVVTRR